MVGRSLPAARGARTGGFAFRVFAAPAPGQALFRSACRDRLPGPARIGLCVPALLPRPALAAQMGTLSFKPEAFRGLRLRVSPCGACPLSYMRLTVAISRVFDRLGVWIGAPSGPSQPAAKRRI